MKLPIYKLTINEGENDATMVDYVALVDEPAIERDFIAFENKIRFKKDEERRIISGPLMIADTPIYRRDEKRGEYYVLFEPKEIEKIVYKFFKNGFTSNVNLMHETPVDGVFMFESFIIDHSRGIRAPEGFEDLTNGSWYGSYKVNNDDVWNKAIKTGVFRGFSVEGVFNYEYEEMKKQTTLDDIIKIVESV